MRQPKLSIGFYPTTVGMVDDDKEYIKQVQFRMVGKERLACLPYNKPEDVLSFLTHQYKSDSFINHCLTSQESSEFDHLVAELNIPAIHQEIYNPRRYAEMSVLVVDFAMPEINGLELARLIRNSNPYIKIIMLTGEAGHNLAVEAFNESSIDHFILKTEPNVTEVLIQAIRKSQKDYFLNLSIMALNKIADFSKATLPCLSDPVFVEFFRQLCVAYQVVEYYLLDVHGSFLLLDAQGKPSILAVADEEIMQTYQRLAQDDHAPATVINALQAKQKIPYFYTTEDFETRPADWEPYLHPAKVLHGEQTYCCAYITDLSHYEFNRDKILSYQQFLETMRPPNH